MRKIDFKLGDVLVIGKHGWQAIAYSESRMFPGDADIHLRRVMDEQLASIKNQEEQIVNQLNVGDAVTLRSGGPMMTIVRPDGGSWACAWDNEGKIEHSSFPAACLRFEYAAKPAAPSPLEKAAAEYKAERENRDKALKAWNSAEGKQRRDLESQAREASRRLRMARERMECAALGIAAVPAGQPREGDILGMPGEAYLPHIPTPLEKAAEEYRLAVAKANDLSARATALDDEACSLRTQANEASQDASRAESRMGGYARGERPQLVVVNENGSPKEIEVFVSGDGYKPGDEIRHTNKIVISAKPVQDV